MKSRILPKDVLLTALRRWRAPGVPIATVRDQPVATNNDGPVALGPSRLLDGGIHNADHIRSTQ